MSLNDLFNSDAFIPIMMLAFVVVIAIAVPAGIAKGAKTEKQIYGDDESCPIREEKNTKIVTRRNTPHPLNQAVMLNMVTFELATAVGLSWRLRIPALTV